MDSINYSSATEDICDTIQKFIGSLMLSSKKELFSVCKKDHKDTPCLINSFWAYSRTSWHDWNGLEVKLYFQDPYKH